MKNKKRKIKTWIKKHKRILMAGAVSVTMLGMFMILRKKETIPTSLEETAQLGDDIRLPKEQIVPRAYTLPTEVVDVRQHIRNLPINWHHSEGKQLEAEALGIVLLPNQTIVDSSKKYVS